MRRGVLAALWLLAAAAASAQPPAPRPEAGAPAAPAPRPARGAPVVAPAVPAPAVPAPTVPAPSPPAAPTPRPGSITETARGAGYAPASAVGALCDDPRLRGRRAPPIRGRGACGVPAPVTLTAVAGVALTRPVTVGCRVAVATADWVEQSAAPAARATLGAPLTAMTPYAGYACRTRNHRAGARLSEHALGRAIDIGAFQAGGRTVDLLSGWRGPADERAFLRAVWRGACACFKTVLGPDADRHHRDHFHFDVARRRGGAWCR